MSATTGTGTVRLQARLQVRLQVRYWLQVRLFGTAGYLHCTRDAVADSYRYPYDYPAASRAAMSINTKTTLSGFPRSFRTVLILAVDLLRLF